MPQTKEMKDLKDEIIESEDRIPPIKLGSREID